MNNYSYSVSLIGDASVKDKVLTTACLDGIAEFDTMSEFGEVLTKHHIAIGIYSDNYRKKENLQKIDFLCYDFDNGTPAQAVHERLNNIYGKPVRHCIVGSKNHLKDKGDGKGILERFHVFVALDKPITNHETYRELWQVFKDVFLHNLTPDPACKDCSRFFARHSQVIFTDDCPNIVSLEKLESILAAHQLRKDKLQEIAELRTKKLYRNEETTSLEKFKRCKWYKVLVQDMSSGSGRYKLAMQIFGAMKACGLDLDQILDLFREHASFGNGTSLKEEHIYRWYRQF